MHTATPFLSLAAAAAAYQLSDNINYVGGDVSKLGPYGISGDKFAQLTSKPTQERIYTFLGPDLSIPATDTASLFINTTFMLKLDVTTDVPLTDANNSTDKSLTTAATVLSLSQPANVSSDWSVCVGVWFGLRSNVTASGTDSDATCSNILPTKCYTDTNDAIQTAVNKAQGDCGAISVTTPPSCAGVYPDGLERVYFKLTPDIFEHERFFALGSAPKAAGDSAAANAALTNIWQISLMYWHAKSSSNTTASSTASDLRCMFAKDSSSPSTTGPAPTTSQTGKPGSASRPAAGVVAWGVVAGLVATLMWL